MKTPHFVHNVGGTMPIIRVDPIKKPSQIAELVAFLESCRNDFKPFAIEMPGSENVQHLEITTPEQLGFFGMGIAFALFVTQDI